MKVALVYDWINKWGGAERVLLVLKKLFPEAPLYTAVYDKDKAQWASVFEIKTSFLQKIPFAANNHEFFFPFLPYAFESFNFDEFDLVISITSSFAKGIITKPETFHLCYCLTPPRYLWINQTDYAGFGPLNPLWEVISSNARLRDQIAAKRVDKFLAISQNVAKRIRKYYQMDSEVVYPPIDFTAKEAKPKFTPHNFFLVVSRLVSHKKIDLAINAFNELNLDLVIIGIGREETKLKRMAKANIHFLKHLTDSELSWYYRHCQALIMPQEEDFGLTAVEAQIAGTPVIAYQAGGALETVIEGRTGCFFYPQNSSSLMKKVRNFERKKYKARDCLESGERFSQTNFKRHFGEIISKLKTD